MTSVDPEHRRRALSDALGGGSLLLIACLMLVGSMSHGIGLIVFFGAPVFLPLAIWRATKVRGLARVGYAAIAAVGFWFMSFIFMAGGFEIYSGVVPLGLALIALSLFSLDHGARQAGSIVHKPPEKRRP